MTRTQPWLCQNSCESWWIRFTFRGMKPGILRRAHSHTRTTLLPEALEKWPVAWFEEMLPRQLEIIYEINRRFLGDVRRTFPGDQERIQRVSLIEEADGQAKKLRMANLAVVGSHSTNGVAEIHSKLLRETTLKNLAEIFPKRFNNKTNGVTPRRWLQLCNRGLSTLITDAIGDGLIRDLREVSKLKAFTEDSGFRWGLPQRQATCQAPILRLAPLVYRADPRSRFDLRLPDQTYSRVQTPIPQRIAYRWARQPATAGPRAKRSSADVPFHRQSRA